MIPAITLTAENTIRDAMRGIEAYPTKIALICDDRGSLIATVTDGDYRRALLDHIGPDSSLSLLLVGKRAPITAPIGTDDAEIHRMMELHSIRQIPIVDGAGRPVDVRTWREMTKPRGPACVALVMAGGLGTRMQHLTADTPKPMLPVDGRPLLSGIVASLQRSGIERITLSLGYRAGQIRSYFRDAVSYVEESEPLGTIGALALVEYGGTVMVHNGDVVTALDYRRLYDWHHEHGAHLTVAVCEYDHQIPFGVVSGDGIQITGIVEKPSVREWYAAGIYCCEPEAKRLIGDGERIDMPDLIRRAIAEGLNVIKFPVGERRNEYTKPEDLEG